MVDILSHHMVYGMTKDYVTGEVIVDTDDERYRQKLARMLVEEKGYFKEDLELRQKIETMFAQNFVVSTVDLVVVLEGKRFMVIRYGPGSLVTRERPALAAARVLEPAYQIPYTVVTNGEDAELLCTLTGKVIARGMGGIPNRNEALKLLADASFDPLPNELRKEKELRILNAYDKETCCVGDPCVLPSAPEG